MDFGFGSVSAVSNSKKRLAPWGIYDVVFNGCEIKEFDGKSDPTQHYKVLQINFDSEDGYYSESLFFPKTGDDVRPKRQNKNGGEYEEPSNWERTRQFIAQLATVLNPDGYRKMCEMSDKFKSFDDICKAFIAITDSKKGTAIQLKLAGKLKNGMVEACIPKFLAIDKNTNKVFVGSNFVGKNLFFNTYEEGQRAQFLNAKPTPMQDVVLVPEEDKVEGLDLSSLIE